MPKYSTINTPNKTREKNYVECHIFQHVSWYGQWYHVSIEKLLGENG